MRVKGLKLLLEGVPDDAHVYVEADHGQLPELAGGLSWTIADEHPNYGDDLEWGSPKKTKNMATAILISN